MIEKGLTGTGHGGNVHPPVRGRERVRRALAAGCDLEPLSWEWLEELALFNTANVQELEEELDRNEQTPDPSEFDGFGY